MRVLVLLEHPSEWALISATMNGNLLSTDDRFASGHTKAEAIAFVPAEYKEMQHELMPIILGDSYRSIFVHVDDLGPPVRVSEAHRAFWAVEGSHP